MDLNQESKGLLSYYTDQYEDNRLKNGAAIVLNNRAEDVFGYVGSQDFFDRESSSENDQVEILNQHGSTLKPFFCAFWHSKRDFIRILYCRMFGVNQGGDAVYVTLKILIEDIAAGSIRVALGSSRCQQYFGNPSGVRKFLGNAFTAWISFTRKNGRALENPGAGNVEVTCLVNRRHFPFSRMGQKITPVGF